MHEHEITGGVYGYNDGKVESVIMIEDIAEEECHWEMCRHVATTDKLAT